MASSSRRRRRRCIRNGSVEFPYRRPLSHKFTHIHSSSDLARTNVIYTAMLSVTLESFRWCPDRWLKYCTQALSFPPLPRQHRIFHQNCLTQTHANCGKTSHRRRMLPGPPETTTPSLTWERSRGDKVLSFIQQPSGLRYHPRWSSHQ